MYIRSAVSARLSILVLSGIGFSQAVGAATIQVCPTCAYSSIQRAVDAAASGDTLNIAAGRYVENVVIAWKQLTLVGAGGGLSYCYIREGNRSIQMPCGVTEVSAPPNSSSPVFTLGSGVLGDPDELITIQGLTISHGAHPLHSGVGGGVQVQAGAYLHLSNSIVEANSAITGGGIGVNSPGAPATTISACLIDANGASVGGGTAGGGIAVLKGSTVSIQNSTITRNQADEGGGIYTASGSSLTMTGTTVSENTVNVFILADFPDYGNGAGLEAHGNFSITDSTFTGNTSEGDTGGGGLLLFLSSGADSSITSTIIDRNIATLNGEGGGLAVYGSADSTLALVNDFIVENQNCGVLNYGANLVLTDTLIKANTLANLCQPDIPGGSPIK